MKTANTDKIADNIFCYQRPRFIRRGEHQRGYNKPRLRFTTFYCNCKGAHAANYRGCIKFIEAERKQRLAHPGAQNRVAALDTNRLITFPPLSGSPTAALATT